MPIHDWSHVDAGLFHHFHHAWTNELSAALNQGVLPPTYFALAEQIIGGPIPDVVTLAHSVPESDDSSSGIALADAPPQAAHIATAETARYSERANRIAVKHRHGEVVAVIEIVSPGNKSSAAALRTFVTKAVELIESGISLLVIDLFPTSARDPQGIHKAIWDEIEEQPFELPAAQPLTVVAYAAGSTKTAYVEPVAVGDLLPSLPIFLSPSHYVPAPLEESYAIAWEKCPQMLRDAVAAPVE